MTDCAPSRIGGAAEEEALNMRGDAMNDDDEKDVSFHADVITSSINEVTSSSINDPAPAAGDRKNLLAYRRGLNQSLLFAFLFFVSSLSLAKGVHEGYEKVICHPDYSNATTVFDYDFKDLEEKVSPMNNFRGKLLLIVNTATY